MINVDKVKTQIDATHAELNSVIDAAVKSRATTGLRSLVLAGQNLEAAEKHLARAVAQTTPKAAK
jgi:cob(I)alamin adenosyltransferase